MTEERAQISDRRTTMDELISKTALLSNLRKERDDYFRAHFNQDPATGTFEASDPKVEYLSDLEERIDFIERFPGIEPIGRVDEGQIKYMVDRFLNWKLPENFNPDGGISFERFGNKDTPQQYTRQPSGTNLIDAEQADAMVRHMIDGLPR